MITDAASLLDAQLRTISGVVGTQVSPDPNSTPAFAFSVHTSGTITVRVLWSSKPTAQQTSQANAIVQAFNLAPRISRPLLDIVTSLNALTGGQKTAVWNDITS